MGLFDFFSKKKKQETEDEWTKDAKFYYGPDYEETSNNESQNWGDGFDDEDNW